MLQEPKEVESLSVRAREIHQDHIRGCLRHPGDEVEDPHLNVGDVGGDRSKPSLVESLSQSRDHILGRVEERDHCLGGRWCGHGSPMPSQAGAR
jgi:hypothetical protein